MVGHLFGYEAALAIDASARPLREARAAIAAVVADARSAPPTLLDRLAPRVEVPAARVLRRAARRRLRRHLEAGTAVRLASLFRYATGVLPLDVLRGRARQGRHAEPAWSRTSPPRSRPAIEELTRPVDAIKHQAKTVTVGISRSDETLLQVPLVRDGARGRRRPRRAQLPGAAHARRPRPRGRARSPASPATAIEGDLARDDATIHVVDRGGDRRVDLRSRTDDDPRLRGTKHRVAAEREVTVARGRQRRPHDGDRPRGARTTRPSGSRCCTCASPSTCPPTSPAPCCRATRVATALSRRGHRDRAHVRRRAAGRVSTSSTCSPSRSTCSPTAGADDGRHRARDPRARNRPGRDRAVPARDRPARSRSPSACSPTTSARTPTVSTIRCRAWRRASVPRRP